MVAIINIHQTIEMPNLPNMTDGEGGATNLIVESLNIRGLGVEYLNADRITVDGVDVGVDLSVLRAKTQNLTASEFLSSFEDSVIVTNNVTAGSCCIGNVVNPLKALEVVGGINLTDALYIDDVKVLDESQLTIGAINCSGNILGTLTTALQPNITSLGTLTALNVAGDINCTGNISGTLSTANQPNITHVGTLTSATVAGNITQTSGTASLQALTVPSITCSGNISGTLTTAAQPNITSLGTLTALNVNNPSSNSNSINCSSNSNDVTTLKIQAPSIPVDSQTSILFGRSSSNYNSGILGFWFNSGGSDSNRITLGFYGDQQYKWLNITKTQRVGIGTSTPSNTLDVVGSCNLSSGNSYKINNSSVLSSTTLGPSVTTSSLTSLGALTSVTIDGNITQSSGTASLQALTVPSITCSGNISGTLITAGQPNITSVGTLTSAIIAGNITQTSGTASLQALTVPSITCSGNISGTLITAGQPNITSVGALSSLTVTGTANIGKVASTAIVADDCFFGRDSVLGSASSPLGASSYGGFYSRYKSWFPSVPPVGSDDMGGQLTYRTINYADIAMNNANDNFVGELTVYLMIKSTSIKQMAILKFTVVKKLGFYTKYIEQWRVNNGITNLNVYQNTSDNLGIEAYHAQTTGDPPTLVYYGASCSWLFQGAI